MRRVTAFYPFEYIYYVMWTMSWFHRLGLFNVLFCSAAFDDYIVTIFDMS